jgi:hypothetical protein
MLQEKALGPLNFVTDATRWGRTTKGVYVDLWKLGYHRDMKNGGSFAKQKLYHGMHTTS